MDVTRANFVEALAVLKSFLPTATFVSIDLEFTGLGETRPSQLDTPATRYQTAKEDAETFPPIQFGISIFRRAPDVRPNGNGASPSPGKASTSESSPSSVPPASHRILSPNAEKPPPDPLDKPKPWQVITFNFNIYPHSVYYPSSTRYPHYDRVVKLQSSSVHFLMEHGFDFAKLFRNGISWVRQETEEDLRKHITATLERKRRAAQNSDIEMVTENKKVVDFYRTSIDEWLKELSKLDRNGENKSEPDISPAPVIKMFSLPKTSIQRKLVYDLVRREYPRIFASSMATQERTQLKMELYPKADHATEKRRQALQKEIEEDVSKAVGFRYVIDAIREAKVPLVVHNGIMDMSKLYANFVAPMPPELNEFKQKLSEAFPVIYDTRWMLQMMYDSHDAVRKAIDLDKARSMDEVICTLQRIVAGKEKGQAPDIRTFVPNGSVDWKGSHVDRAVLSWREVGVEIHENGNPSDSKLDRYGFGRYALSKEARFEHEAGFDAMETGRLFILLLHIANLVSGLPDVELTSRELAGARNKVMLGACGGYRYIDITTQSEDEDNIYFRENVVVISGEWNGGEEGQKIHSNRRRRLLVEKVTTGTPFDVGRSSIITVGPSTVLVVLKGNKVESHSREGKRTRDEPDKPSSDLQRVVENGKRIGVEIELYENVVRRTGSEALQKLKKRRCV